MKVHIPKSDKIAGPQLFCSRLHKEFERIPEVELTFSKDADVVLHNITMDYYIHHAKNILRLDGVYFNTEQDWERLNKPLKESFEKADGIVYQSFFSKTLCDKYLGEPNKPWKIIFNGADPKEFTNIVSYKISKPYFLAVARWRPFKRLKETIEGFLESELSTNYRLVILGDISKSGLTKFEMDKYQFGGRVHFEGKCDSQEVKRWLAGCEALIHLSWIDSCPNSVVEAICAGKPVICGNFAGTPEIVNLGGGVILDLEKPYDLSPRDIYNPPEIDLNKVSQGLNDFVNNYQHNPVCPSVFYIKNTARCYLEFFKEVLNGRPQFTI